MAVSIEVSHEAAEIRELVVGVHDDGGFAIGTGGVDGVVRREGRRMAGEGHGDIVGIAKTGVGARCEDDVHIREHRRENEFVRDLLKVRHEDDLVHALALEVINHGLHLAGEQHHVVHFAAITDEALHLDTARGGDAFEDLRGDADEADLLRALRDDAARHDLVLHTAGFFETADADRFLIAAGNAGITGEVEVRGQIREVRVEDGIGEGIRAEVELMVADRGGFHAEAVVNFDVRGEGIVAFVMGGGHERIGAGGGEGSRDVVVTTGEDQRVRVSAVKRIHESGEVRRGLGGEQSSLRIGEVEELHGEGGGRCELENAQRVAAFVRHEHERAAAGAVGFGDDDDAFGIEITSANQRGDVGRSERIRDIKHQRQVRTLQADEGEGAGTERRHGHAFRLGAFVVAAAVIEVAVVQRGDDHFDHVTAVEDDGTRGIEDGEAASAIHEDLVDVAVVVRVATQAGKVGDGEPSEVGVELQSGCVREDGGIEHIAGVADGGGLVRSDEVIAVVALIRGHIVGLTAGGEGSDGVRHVEAKHRLAGARVLHSVLVAEVGAEGAEVLFAERSHAGEGGAGDVEHGDRVGLLQRNHGLRAIGRDGEVFRLKVGGRHAVIEDADTGGFESGGLRIEGGEIGGLHGSSDTSGIDGDDAHRALGSIGHGDLDGDLRLGKLTLIADEQLGAIGSEGDVIGHHADGGVTDQRTRGGIEEDHEAGICLRIADDGGGEHAGVAAAAFAHGHGRDVIAGEADDAECGGCDRIDEHRSRRISQVHDLDADAGGGTGAVGKRIKGRDLRTGEADTAFDRGAERVAGREDHRRGVVIADRARRSRICDGGGADGVHHIRERDDEGFIRFNRGVAGDGNTHILRGGATSGESERAGGGGVVATSRRGAVRGGEIDREGSVAVAAGDGEAQRAAAAVAFGDGGIADDDGGVVLRSGNRRAGRADLIRIGEGDEGTIRADGAQRGEAHVVGSDGVVEGGKRRGAG